MVEAIHAATALGGELMGLDVGRVAEGCLADFIPVEGDPAKDVALLRDAGNLLAIMKDGRRAAE